MADDTNNLPDEESGEAIDPSSQGENPEIRQRRRHRKIKVRKRVKIKKRRSPKKKARKMLETVAWVVIVAAFIFTIIMMVLQLDMDSKHRNKKRTFITSEPAECLIGCIQKNNIGISKSYYVKV